MPARPAAAESDSLFQPWSQFLPKAGLTLRGWHTAPRGKPLIHFLHGNGFCGRAYEPMLRWLAADFDLWLTDVQGHGDSDAGAGFLGWNRNAELALKAFEAGRGAYGEVPVHAVGHSFGGVLTTLILARRRQPFDKAVLLDPVLFPPRLLLGAQVMGPAGLLRYTPLARAAARRRRHWPDRTAAMDALRGRGTYAGWTEAALRAFADHALRDEADGGVALKCEPRLEATIFSSTPRALWPAVARVRVPTLLLHGLSTMPFVPASAARAAQLSASIRVAGVDGGHCFMQQHPAEAAARIRAFLLA